MQICVTGIDFAFVHTIFSFHFFIYCFMCFLNFFDLQFAFLEDSQPHCTTFNIESRSSHPNLRAATMCDLISVAYTLVEDISISFDNVQHALLTEDTLQDTIDIIRIRKSKDRLCNNQRKKDRQCIIRPHLETGV